MIADCPVLWANKFDPSRSKLIVFRPLAPAILITDKFKSLGIISNQEEVTGSQRLETFPDCERTGWRWPWGQMLGEELKEMQRYTRQRSLSF